MTTLFFKASCQTTLIFRNRPFVSSRASPERSKEAEAEEEEDGEEQEEEAGGSGRGRKGGSPCARNLDLHS